MTPEPGIDVVIPTFNAKQLVLECVERLLGAPSIATVTVVDDASWDGTVESLTERYPLVHTVRLAEHRGLAHALNVGAAHGQSDYVLFLNNDVLAQPGAPSRLAEALQQDPQAVAAGGALVDPGTRDVQARYQPWRFPGAVELLIRLLGIERLWPANPWTGHHLTAPLDQSRRQRTGRQLAGACLMVRRSSLGSVGGWDERYWMFYEDVDLLRRLAAIGAAVYVPDAIFEHLGGASTAAWRKPELHRRLYHGTLVYAQAHLSRFDQVAVGLTMLAACLVRLGAYSVSGDPAAAGVYRDLARSAAATATLRPVPQQVSVRGGVRR